MQRAESLKEFCRETILAKADDILAKKKRGKYPELKEMRTAKVAENEGR